MVVIDYGGYQGYIDGYLHKNLELYQKMVKGNRDFVILASGKEGDGKSVLMAGILKRLDPTFNLDRCFLNGEDFLKALVDAREPFKAYMFDEGQEFTSRAAMSRFNKALVQVLSKIRAKQLYIGICIPAFHELDKYAAVHRSHCLLQVYTKKGRRGFFNFWNWEKKKKLYWQGKQNYDYNCVPANFNGKFTYNSFPFDQKEYDQKKFDSMEAIDLNLRDAMLKSTKQRDALMKYLIDVVGLKQLDVAEIVNKSGVPLSQSRISAIMVKLKEKNSPVEANTPQ